MSPPFFIVGFQRSGTTLLRVMLDSHPDVAVPLDVTGLWARYEDRLDAYGDLRREDDLRRLIRDLLDEERIRLWEGGFGEEDVLAELRGDGRGAEEGGGGEAGVTYSAVIEAFYRAYAHRRGKSRWGDKDPGNTTRLDRLQRWFPKGRIVHIVRDGRDACLSHLRQTFGFDDLLTCAEGWREQVWWVRKIGAILGPERYHELRYEDLVREPEAELRRICGFLDLEWTPEMLSYHRRTEEAIPASKRHIWPMIGRPPQADQVARWKERMSEATRTCFEKRAGEVLRESGYETLPDPSGAYGEELRHLLARAWRGIRRRFGRG